MIVIWQWKPSRNKAGAYMKTLTNKDHRTGERNLFPNLFSSRVYTAADPDAPTPSDSEGDMDVSPDLEPDQDPSPGPEIEDQEHQSGRQKASAHLEPFHPPTVIAKLCSSAFKRNTSRILEDVS